MTEPPRLPSEEGRGGEAFQECEARRAGVIGWPVHTRRGHEDWKQSRAWATEQAGKEVRRQGPAGRPGAPAAGRLLVSPAVRWK